MASSKVIAVSSKGKAYLKRVVRNGPVQRAFAEKIGRPVGACVAAKIPKNTYGYSATDMKNVLKNCTAAHRGPGALGFTAKDPYAGKTKKSDSWTPVV